MTEHPHRTDDETPSDATSADAGLPDEAPAEDTPLDAAPAEAAPAEDADAGPDARVATALRRLDTLPEDDPAEHVAVYEDVHRTLQESLAEAAGRDREDAPPGGGGGAGP